MIASSGRRFAVDRLDDSAVIGALESRIGVERRDTIPSDQRQPRDAQDRRRWRDDQRQARRHVALPAVIQLERPQHPDAAPEPERQADLGGQQQLDVIRAEHAQRQKQPDRDDHPQRRDQQRPQRPAAEGQQPEQQQQAGDRQRRAGGRAAEGQPLKHGVERLGERRRVAGVGPVRHLMDRGRQPRRIEQDGQQVGEDVKQQDA